MLLISLRTKTDPWPSPAGRGSATLPAGGLPGLEDSHLIFLAWSGERSKEVALALHESLQFICNSFHSWMRGKPDRWRSVWPGAAPHGIVRGVQWPGRACLH